MLVSGDRSGALISTKCSRVRFEHMATVQAHSYAIRPVVGGPPGPTVALEALVAGGSTVM